MTGVDLLLSWVTTAATAVILWSLLTVLADVPLWAWAALAFAFWGFGMLSLAGLI